MAAQFHPKHNIQIEVLMGQNSHLQTRTLKHAVQLYYKHFYPQFYILLVVVIADCLYPSSPKSI